jgi:uncharacterized Zn finger protein
MKGVAVQGGEENHPYREENPYLRPPDSPDILPDPLPQNPRDFWQPENPSLAGPFDTDIPLIPAVLPKRLGPFPFWRGDRDLAEELEIIYDEASSSAYEMVSSEEGGSSE